jgi:hypothetical protein
VGKENTPEIESKHINLRTRIKRLIRRTICFSKLVSLRQVAAQRDMSEEALLKFYIGQGLRQDLAPLWGPRAGHHGPCPRTAPPIR